MTAAAGTMTLCIECGAAGLVWQDQGNGRRRQVDCSVCEGVGKFEFTGHAARGTARVRTPVDV